MWVSVSVCVSAAAVWSDSTCKVGLFLFRAYLFILCNVLNSGQDMSVWGKHLGGWVCVCQKEKEKHHHSFSSARGHVCFPVVASCSCLTSPTFKLPNPETKTLSVPYTYSMFNKTFRTGLPLYMKSIHLQLQLLKSFWKSLIVLKQCRVNSKSADLCKLHD